jgi:[acyl-carrier-protein] S-malonyltransferase
MKIAYLFPGQGSQYVGMGKELYDGFPAAKKVFDQALHRLGPEYIDVIFSGPEDKLRQTRFTQVSLFIVSMAAHEVLKEAGWKPAFAAGHSLGEYSALCAAGAFNFETGLQLVKARGEAIQEASEKIPGTMAAVVGLERAQVEEICRQAGVKGVCEAVNFNCPGQIVIAGAVPAVEEAVVLAQQAGSLKSIKLNVSGPFHSSLMQPAAERMAAVLEKAAIQDPSIAVVANCDAQATRSAADIRRKLVQQIDHPVLWEDSLRTLFTQGADTFIETGPGRVLSGLLRRTDKSKKFFNIEDKKSAEALLQTLVP